MEVLECGFLGPGVTQLTVAEFAAVEEWEEARGWGASEVPFWATPPQELSGSSVSNLP